MSWGLGWKRSSEIFRLTLDYGDYGDNAGDPCPTSPPPQSRAQSPDPRPSSNELGFRIDLEWSAGDDEEQVALRLQSQLMVALPPPQDTVLIDLRESGGDEEEVLVGVEMKVMKLREPLRVVTMYKASGSGQQNDGIGVFTRLLRSNLAPSATRDGVSSFAEHWRSLTVLNLCGCGFSAKSLLSISIRVACGLSMLLTGGPCERLPSIENEDRIMVLPIELTKLSLLEKLYLDNNKLGQLPPELGDLKNLKVLSVDNNMLVSVPVELRQCVMLVELSLEHNKLVRPLLDFRAMSELRILRLFGNPLEFLPEILPLHNLRHLSLANIRIDATENIKAVSVQIETDNGSYFTASKHKLSPFFSLIFRFSSCHHPLLASALAKLMEDQNNRLAISKEENAVRQLISMMSSENRHVVEQACSALSSLASDVSLAMQLIKSDIMQPIGSVLKSVDQEELISVLQVIATLAFASDSVAQKMLTKDILKSLKGLCGHKNIEVQSLALFVVGNLAFCLENRCTLVQSESLRELLLRLMVAPEPRVNKAAARENETLRKAIRGKPVGKQGLRILAMDGGGMKGMATVQMLKQIERGTGKRIHELFDLICGTSTGGMLAIALGVKQMTLDRCEEVYKELGKLVFAEPIPKDNEAASWREKLDQLYKSSSQSFRVVVHGSKHSADQFERLLKELCADEEGDLLIESAVKKIPKYPVGTPELSTGLPESPAFSGLGTTAPGPQLGAHRSAFMGSCKHKIWEAIRASSAAPYYLDDFSDGVNRWQDGAILANNPTIFAIREAQLLWPDTRIDCLVSIGCGSVPTKVRKGGWRYLDTGQVLIESACSVERVEETMDTLMPLLPEMQYFRFNPVDERCGMELDETDPAIWLKLEAATEDYIQKSTPAFQNLCERLLPRNKLEEKIAEKLKNHHFSNSKLSTAVLDDNSPSLGWRRMVLLIESSYSLDIRKAANHARALEAFCVRNNIKLSLAYQPSEFSKPATAFPTPFTSPMLAGSFPSSPLVYSPEGGPQRMSQIDLIPPLCLDAHPTGKATVSSPASPLAPRQPSIHVRSLNEKLQNLPQVGLIHLALQNDATGLILSWQNDVFVVAEPGELADKFLRSVKLSLSIMMRDHKSKDMYSLSKVLTVSDLVAHWPRFEVMEDNQEIGAYMFRRIIPAIHLTPEDIRWMVGAWRDRIVICTGKCGPAPSLVKAFLDSGAKAVIASSADPPDAESVALHGAGEYGDFENGKFVIGDEEADDNEEQPPSPSSDWEDSDAEIARSVDMNEVDEEELSGFVRDLYDVLFRDGATVNAALSHALHSNPKLRYIEFLDVVNPENHVTISKY
ncbi:LRR repeats and ubiquitin-like domain-containing protein [Apostasia shenzhenica]|uniref:Patatin n=1 Tax=Apostasia shenzhenica TaxID=1088818 RepID=A0A2H9ZQS9_9ASPA|nr:LRR repeats and ubiquitin-like domain-containing protein [Apostasia shenzhenica]